VKSRDKIAQEVMHYARRLLRHKSGALPIITGGEVSRHVFFITSRGTCRDVVHLDPDTWSSLPPKVP
jgi:hypothetical protein